MFISGRCVICTSGFTATNVFSLPCGHTFHEDCIRQWLKAPGRGCPNCRRKCHNKDVVRIFFEAGLDDTLDSTAQGTDDKLLRVKNEELQLQLALVNAEVAKAKQDLLSQANERAKLEEIVMKEKEAAKKALRKMGLKENELQQMRMILHDHSSTEKENKTLKQCLEASDFYRDMFRGADPVEAIHKYLDNKGDPDTAKFMELQSRSLEMEKKKRNQLAKELQIKGKRIQELEMEKRQLQELVRTLTEECKSHGITTPQNPKTKKLFEMSPPRRDSLEMFSNQPISDSVLASVMRGKRPLPSFKPMAGPSKVTWSEEKRRRDDNQENVQSSPTTSSVPTINLGTPDVDVFEKITVPTRAKQRVMDIQAPKIVFTSKKPGKSNSDGLGGSIHHLKDRVMARIDNTLSPFMRAHPDNNANRGHKTVILQTKQVAAKPPKIGRKNNPIVLD